MVIMICIDIVKDVYSLIHAHTHTQFILFTYSVTGVSLKFDN